jgi:hypothetical protein
VSQWFSFGSTYQAAVEHCIHSPQIKAHAIKRRGYFSFY